MKSKRNRVKHTKTGILGTAKIEDDHGNAAVEWDDGTAAITPPEDLEWYVLDDDEIPFEAEADAREKTYSHRRQMIVIQLCLLAGLNERERPLIERAFSDCASDEWLDLAEVVTGVLFKRYHPEENPT